MFPETVERENKRKRLCFSGKLFPSYFGLFVCLFAYFSVYKSKFVCPILEDGRASIGGEGTENGDNERIDNSKRKHAIPHFLLSPFSRATKLRYMAVLKGDCGCMGVLCTSPSRDLSGPLPVFVSSDIAHPFPLFPAHSFPKPEKSRKEGGRGEQREGSG